MQDTAITQGSGAQPGTFIRRRGLTAGVVVAWLLAAIAGGTLAWATPRASETKRLDAKVLSLRGELSAARGRTAGAEQRLADLQAELDAQDGTQSRLKETLGDNEKAIAVLRRQIRRLKSAIADAKAAATSSTSTAPISPPNVEHCTPWVDPYTGETGCT